MKNPDSLSTVLGIKFPIIQGPFGSGLSSVQLTSTVSNLGGLGSFGAQIFSPAEITSIVKNIKKVTSKPFAINLWVSNRDENAISFSKEAYEKVVASFKPYFDKFGIEVPALPSLSDFTFEQQAEAVIQLKAPVFSFVFGIPDRAIIVECKKQHIKMIGTATTVDEALALEEAGVDAVVASGFEAGGHRVSFIKSAEDSLHGTFSLIPLIADRVKKTSIIAAGGIVNARTASAALMLGAQGVQVGTAFLACVESGTTDLHRRILFSDRVNESSLTKVLTGRLARGTRSILSSEFASSSELLPYPLQGSFLHSLRAEMIKQGKEEFVTFWAGQSAPLLQYHTAGEVFAEILKGVEGYASNF